MHHQHPRVSLQQIRRQCVGAGPHPYCILAQAGARCPALTSCCMKLLLLCGALLATPAIASVPAPSLSLAAPATKVAVFFTRKTTFTQLSTIKQQVLQDDLVLEYDRLEFDKDGYLTKISFHVESAGVTLGSATEDNVPADCSFGFLRDFTPGAKVQFKIGNF